MCIRDRHNILSTFQHGFRAKRSCESQLFITLQDFMSNWDSKRQVDVAVLDFAKAFDTVPHRSLLNKLKLSYYGIDGNIYRWIRSL